MKARYVALGVLVIALAAAWVLKPYVFPREAPVTVSQEAVTPAKVRPLRDMSMRPTLLEKERGPGPDVRSEMQTREDLFAEVRLLWENMDYAALDELYSHYATTQARSPSGLWKTGMLLDALSENVRYDVDDERWEYLLKKNILSWPASSPNSPVAHLQVANMHFNRATQKRGGGPAQEVSPEGWKGFEQHLELARDYLESTKSVSGTDMSWYVIMGRIAYLQGDHDRYQELLREAIKKNRDYYPLYFAAILFAATPGWGGSIEKVEGMATHFASHFPEAQGDAVYARIYWFVSNLNFKGMWRNPIIGDRQLRDTNVDCARMVRGMAVVASDFPDQWNYNNFARFAVECNDLEAARTYFNLIGEEREPEAWDNDGLPDTGLEMFQQYRAIATGVEPPPEA